MLICIDQPPASQNPYLTLLEDWTNNPFAEMHQLNRHRNIYTKLTTRQAGFSALRRLVQRLQPTWIFTGSDRRVEFQFAVALAKKIGGATGVYLDEGTFSYVTRKASRSWGDRYVDNWAKKLVYGRWWRNPPTTGASLWIDRCCLFFPQYANNWLQQKELDRLKPELFRNVTMQELFSRIVSWQGLDKKKLGQAKYLLTMPHHSLLGETRVYVELVQRLQQQGARVVVKYHPRSSASEYPGIEALQPWHSITGPLMFEALLTLLPQDTVLLGDLSSTLLVARWLRPQMRIIAMAAGGARETKYQLFLRRIGVEIQSPDQIGAI